MRVPLPLLLVAGCGRFAFDTQSATGDPQLSDASGADGSSSDGTGPAFGTPCFALSDNPTYLDPYMTGDTGWLDAIKIVPPAALHVTRLEVFTGEVMGASALGLWSHDIANNRPQADLGTTAFQIALPNGWQGPDLAAPIDLAGGTAVWLVWTMVLGAQVTIEANTALPTNPEARGSSDGGATWNGPYMFYPYKLRLWCDGAHP